MSRQQFTRFAAIAGLAVGILACGTARAALTYSYIFDQSTYTVTPGGQVDVKVSLQETGTPGDVFVLAPGGIGLIAAGGFVLFPSPGAVTIQSDSDISGNPAATFVNRGQTPGSAFVFEAFGPPVPETGTLVAPDTYDLFVGTFKFTAGPTPGTATIEADGLSGQVATSFGTALDVANTTATIDVAPAAVAVPEPANVLTALAAAIGAAGWMGWAWIRRRPPDANAGGSDALT